MVRLCVDRQLLPGPETHRAHTHLKKKVASGELEASQPYEYYLEALERDGL